jgi:D-arabinitol 4-dehydrogenase
MSETGALNPEDPSIVAELDGGAPRTVYAYLTRALARRKAAGLGGISILCCDNIRRNGKMLQSNLFAYLDLIGAGDLGEWVRNCVTFPCSMVDRITPRSTEALQSEVDALFGPGPFSPVMAEDFTQWVVDDHFAAARPDLTKVGVTFTKNVDPYEEAKIRILNGGHTCLAYLGALAGHHTFDQAMADPQLFAHFEEFERSEVLPALVDELPFDKNLYLDQIITRFKNASIGDTVERICADGYLKFPIFIHPTLAGCLKQGIMPQAGLRAIASWYVFCKHIEAGTLPIAYGEPYWDNLRELLQDGQVDRFAQSASLWGTLPQEHPEFITALIAAITEMEKEWPV